MADAFLGDGWTGTTGDPTPTGDEFDPVAAAAWADGLEPVSDLDRDGVPDTVVFDSGVFGSEVFDAGSGRADTVGALVVASDTDLDGYTDRLTAVEDDGEYGVWELHRDPDGTTRWTRIDEGNLEDDVDHEGEGK